MKRTAVKIILAALIVVFALTLAVGAADTNSQISDKLNGAASDVADSIGSELVENAFGEDIESTGAGLASALSVDKMLDEVGEVLSVTLKDALALLCVTSGLILISALCNRICDGFATPALKNGFGFCSAAAIGAAFVSIQTGVAVRVADFFENMTALIDSMIPITGAVWAMGGNIGTASVGTAALYAFMSLTEKLCADSVYPVCCVMSIAAICSGISDGGLLGGFTGAVKKIYNFFIAAVMVIVVFVLGTQTSIAASADTVAARGGKLLASTLIPGVGGAVGDTLRTVAGSVQYVKSVVGVGGVLLVVALTLPTIASLLMTRLAFLISAAEAQMLECRREAQLLTELGNVYACLLGAVSICSVAFCVCLAIFVKGTVAVG